MSTHKLLSGSLHDGNWHHVAITRSGTTIRMFANGVEKGSFTDSRTLGNATFRNAVGAQDPTMSSETWNGYLDELRAIKGTALTADQIRQAYEYGLRAHQITIDFAAKLDAANLISGLSDTAFTIDATAYGLTQKGSNLYPGTRSSSERMLTAQSPLLKGR